MSRQITAEERNVLLENPELVMFDPYRGFKPHRGSLGKALILPAVIGVLVFVWGYLCPDFIQSHPKLFAGIGCVALIVAVGSVPILYLVSDDRTFKKAKAERYAGQLKLLLPKDLECGIAHIQWVEVSNAEGGWVLGGKEEMFGFSSYVNQFKIEPDTDLAVIRGGDTFQAFVKRDTKTERFYRNG